MRLNYRKKIIIIGAVAAALLIALFVTQSKRGRGFAPWHPPTVAVERAGPAWAYPDPNRTPGFVNPNITQANIEETICNPNWSTKNIRPPASYTTKLKRAQIQQWGLPGATADYEEDHFISLDLGGSPTDYRNLWPEPYAPKPGAREKDVVERYLHKEVCAGAMTLEAAQNAITTDWYRIYMQIQR